MAWALKSCDWVEAMISFWLREVLERWKSESKIWSAKLIWEGLCFWSEVICLERTKAESGQHVAISVIFSLSISLVISLIPSSFISINLPLTLTLTTLSFVIYASSLICICLSNYSMNFSLSAAPDFLYNSMMVFDDWLCCSRINWEWFNGCSACERFIRVYWSCESSLNFLLRCTIFGAGLT